MNQKMNSKSQSKSILKTLLGSVIMCIMLVASLITFSACKLTNSGGGSNSNFVDGKLRLLAPTVTFNPYSLQEDGTKVVDENSGSFTWRLLYYLQDGTEEQLQDIDYDQGAYLSNVYTDPELKNVFDYRKYSPKRPFYVTSSISAVQEYYGVGAPIKNIFNGSSGLVRNSFYALYVDDNGEQKYTKVFTKADKVISNPSSINFPDYQVVVDGKFYTFRVTLNRQKLGGSQTKINNPYIDTSDESINEHSLFTFQYQTGKTAVTNGNSWIDCPEDFITYFTDEDGYFCIRFNPRLENGTTNRYLKVKAIPKTTKRAESLYSSTVRFEAYRLTFETYSPNSVDLSYGGLSYNEDAYYFLSQKTVYDRITDKNYITSLSGYFPEGRKVVVTRSVPYTDDYDYAFQNCSVNAKAENSVTIPVTLPKNVENYNGGNNCIPDAIATGNKGFDYVRLSVYNENDANNIAPIDLTFDYFAKASDNSVSNFVKEKLYAMRELVAGENAEDEMAGVTYINNPDRIAIKGDLSVVAHPNVDGYKFYSNYAKVRNFYASGTIFAGDNFFTGDNQYLSGVAISVFDASGNRLCYANNTMQAVITVDELNQRLREYGLAENRTKPITYSFDGAFFSVKGLEHGDFLLFEKEGEPLIEDKFEVSGLLPYSFHSPLFVERQIVELNREPKKVLEMRVTSTLYTDRQDLGIIATQYAEESNLIVNLYQIVDGAEEPEQISGTNLKLLSNSNVSYEIVKSVSSYEDTYGYITTNVILSILIPSNCTLVGYNAETLNNVTMIFYGRDNNGDGYGDARQYVNIKTYDASKMDYVNTYYSYSTASVTATDIIQTPTSTYVLYNDEAYVYSHKDSTTIGSGTGASTTTTFYYTLLNPPANSSSIKTLAKTVNSANATNSEWSLLTYTMIDQSSVSANLTADKRVNLTINGSVMKSCADSPDANQLSVVAEVYKTEMTQTATVTSVSGGTTNETIPIYVYYDTKLAGGKRYYTAPIAKQTIIGETNAGGGTNNNVLKVDELLYFEEITNFEALKGTAIMLGSDLVKSSNPDAQIFEEVLGAKIIHSCYYYILPVGEGDTCEASTVLVKQYMQTNEDATQTTSVVRYYYNSNGTNEYTGVVTKNKILSGGSVVVNSVIEYFDAVSRKLDISLSNGVITDKLFDSSGSTSINFSTYQQRQTHKSITVAELEMATYDKDATTGEFVENEEGTGTFVYLNGTYYAIVNLNNQLITPLITNNINVTYTLEYFDKNGSLISENYCYMNSKYYKIISSPTAFKLKNSDESVNVYIRELAETKLSFLGTYNNLTNITVTSINNVSTCQTYNGQTTSYNAILKPTFYYTNNGVRTQYYKGYSVGGKIIVPTSIKLVGECEYRYTDTNGRTLYEIVKTETIQVPETSLVRSAQLIVSNRQVCVLGKYLLTNDTEEPIIYPSFSYLNVVEEEDAYILDSNTEKDFSHYYSLDYTSKKIVVEGFPGVKLLAGSPYPNPVLHFSVRHKRNQTAVLNLGLDIKEAFFVEIMGTFIETEKSNLIQDFTTYAFKDTLTNMSLNDYINKTYLILDKVTLKPIIPYYNVGAIYKPKFLDENNNPLELNFQDVGLNEDSIYLYYNDTVNVHNEYINLVYMQYTMEDGSIGYKPINYEQDVIVWKSDATKIENVPMYDIHTYYQDKDGIIYFNSGSNTDDNQLCIGLNGISAGATQDENGYYNYDQVLLSGVTNVYRTKASEVPVGTNIDNLEGYWFDIPLDILNAYDSNQAYFLSGKEAAVFVPSPTVSISDDEGFEYIYRFKKWRIYSRYNSEVLYYNRELTEGLGERASNAILSFSSDEAGYFVILPVYERIYSIDIGTAIIDGPINQGGGINVLYDNNSAEVDVDEAYDRTLYLLDYFKTLYNDKEGYYYGAIEISPFLWFTGTYTDEVREPSDDPLVQGDIVVNSGIPIFEKSITNVYSIKFNQTFDTFNSGDVNLYFQIIYSGNGEITEIKPVKVLTQLGTEAGLVELSNNNGDYSFLYNTKDTASNELHLLFNEAFLYFVNEDGEYEIGTVEDLAGYTFNTNFFYDSILGENKSSYNTPLYYDYEETEGFDGSRYFYELDVDIFDDYIPYDATFKEYLTYWHMYNNSHMFNLSSVFYAVANNYYTNNHEQMNVNSISPSENIHSLLRTIVAQSTTNLFKVLPIVNDNVTNQEYSMKVSSNSLMVGELARDEFGNLYATQQFKSAYIDRDAKIILEAVPDNGYRVEGWYRCEFDEDTQTWYTTDEKIENSSEIYTDEILQAYYNKTLNKYYYKTAYYETYGSGENTNRIYFYDRDKKQVAEVPTNMLDKVRGYFINLGTATSKNYVQVYKKATLSNAEYYYDAEFTRVVDIKGLGLTVEEMPYVDAIKTHSGLGGYTLSNVYIYKVTDEDGMTKYYRTKTSGNVVVEGNNLIINQLHANVRYVAKFLEIYEQYIFTENEEAFGIRVNAVYYANKTKDDAKPVMRTDADGNHSTTYDNSVTSMSPSSDMKLYDDDSRRDYLTSSFMRKTFTVSTSTGDQDFTYYDEESINNFNNILTKTYGMGDRRQVYKVNPNADPTLEGKLSLRNMYFDANTTVYIVVSVEANFNLTVHSLGMNSTYEITPIVQPNEAFVQYNRTLGEDKVDFLYYVFAITYNRDPENQDKSYIVHPTRGDSMAYDVLMGNYLSFYNNYFEIYDNNGIKIDYSFTGTNIEQRVTINKYLQSLRDAGLIANNIYNTLYGKTYKNVEKALEAVSKAIKRPGAFTPTYAKYTQTYLDTYYNTASIEYQELLEYQMTTSEQIYEAIKNVMRNINLTYKQTDGAEGKECLPPYVIYSGTRNFVNFSSIPIYAYTIQTMTIDGYAMNETGTDFAVDPDTGKMVLNNIAVYKDVDGVPVQQHTLLNSLYVAAGTNDKNYIGSGTKLDITESPFNYTAHSEDKYYPEGTEFRFRTQYINLPYADNNENKTVISDLAFAQDSIVVFAGATPVVEGYAFVGWYEQKFNKELQQWSELVLKSEDLLTPYLSLATADTIIVAAYKKLVDVVITYNNEETSMQLPYGGKDSLNNDLTVSVDDATHTTTVKGTFFIDTAIDLVLSSTGGYRIDGIDYSYDAVIDGTNTTVTGTADMSHTGIECKVGDIWGTGEVPSYQEKLVNYKDAPLNGVLDMRFPFKQVIGTADNYSKITLNVKTKRTVLVYVDVDGYYNGGQDIAIYRYDEEDTTFSNPQLLIKTTGSQDLNNFYVTKEGEDQYYDDAHNPIFCSIENNNKLHMYGYFDYETSGRILIVTTHRETKPNYNMNEWYINGYNTPTKVMPNLYTNLFTGEKSTEHLINFKYIDELTDSTDLDYLNLKYKFGLDEKNAIYHAHAIVEASNDTTISHTLAESIAQWSSQGTPVTGLSSLVSYNGPRYYLHEGSEFFDKSGNLIVNDQETFRFDVNTIINLSAKQEYINANGSVYVFAGWFRIAPNGLCTLISQEQHVKNVTVGTYSYEAKYIKVHKIEYKDHLYGQINPVEYQTIDNKEVQVYEFSDELGYNYIFSGATLVLRLVPDAEYIVKTHEHYNFGTTTLGGLSEQYEQEKLYDVYTILNIDKALTINIQFDIGCYVTVHQRLYTSYIKALTTTQDAVYIVDSLTHFSIEGEGTYTNKVMLLPISTLVEFYTDDASFSDTYYFAGWFINGKLVAEDDYSLSLTTDLVIEARFVPIVTVTLVAKSFSGASLTGATLKHSLVGNSGLYLGDNKYTQGSTIKLENTVAPSGNFEFNSWCSTDGINIKKQLSYNQTHEVTLLPEYINANSEALFISRYAEYSLLDVSKVISLRTSETGFINNEKPSLFLLTVTYLDVTNTWQTLTLSYEIQVNNIKVLEGSTLTVSYAITQMASDRYVGSINVNGSDVSNGAVCDVDRNEMNVVGVFVPGMYLEFLKETDRSSTMTIERYDNIDLSKSQTFSCTAEGGVNEIFIGWYVNGLLVTKDKTISVTVNSSYQNTTYIARFMIKTTVTIQVMLDHEYVTSDSSSPFYISFQSNFVSDSDNISVDYGSTRSFESFNLLASAGMILQASNHNSDYYFKGFTIEGGGYYATNEYNQVDNVFEYKFNLSSSTNILITAEYLTLYEIKVNTNNVYYSRFGSSGVIISSGGLLHEIDGSQYYTIETGTINLSYPDLSEDYMVKNILANGTIFASFSNEQRNLGYSNISLASLNGYKSQITIDFNFKRYTYNVVISSYSSAHATNVSTSVSKVTLIDDSISITVDFASSGNSDNYYQVSAIDITNSAGTVTSSFSDEGFAEDGTRTCSFDKSVSDKPEEETLNISITFVKRTFTLDIIADIGGGYTMTLKSDIEYEAGKEYNYRIPETIIDMEDTEYDYEGGSNQSVSITVNKKETVKYLTYSVAICELTIKADLGFLKSTVLKTDEVNFNTDYEYPCPSSTEYNNYVYDYTGSSPIKFKVNERKMTYEISSRYWSERTLTLEVECVGTDGTPLNTHYKYNIEQHTTVSVKLNSSYTVGGVKYTISDTDKSYSMGTTDKSVTVTYTKETPKEEEEEEKEEEATFAPMINSPAPTHSNLNSNSYNAINNSYVVTNAALSLGGSKSESQDDWDSDSEAVTCLSGLNPQLKSINNTTNDNWLYIYDMITVTFNYYLSGVASSGTSSQLEVSIYTSTGEIKEYAVVSHGQSIDVPKNSIIMLRTLVGHHEKFVKYSMDGSSSTSITDEFVATSLRTVVEVHLQKNYTVNVTAVQKLTTSGAITDESVGSVEVSQYDGTNGNFYTLSIKSSANYRIASILVDSNSSGTALIYEGNGASYNNVAGAVRNITSVSLSTAMSDCIMTSYVYNSKIRFEALTNIYITVTFEHVTKVYLHREINNYNSNKMTPKTIYFYQYESQNTVSGAKMMDVLATVTGGTDFYINTLYHKGSIVTETSTYSLVGVPTIEIDVDQRVNAKIKVVISTIIDETIGNNTYQTPTIGLEVFKKDGTNLTSISTFSGTSAVFEYNTIYPLTLIAKDNKSYFDFTGFYSGPKASGTVISTFENYGIYDTEHPGYDLNPKDFNSLTKDGDTYVIYAVFTERLKTITIKQNYVQGNIEIKTDGGGKVTPTTTLQRCTAYNTYGNFTYMVNSSNNDLVITYPVSLAINNKRLGFVESSFTTIVSSTSTEPLLSVYNVPRFYEKYLTIEEEGELDQSAYYRFYNFLDEDNNKLGTDYHNEISINLNNYRDGAEFRAVAKRLYNVEFGYNYYSPNFKITLSIEYVNDANELKRILIGGSSNISAFNNFLLKYKVEEGFAVCAEVTETKRVDGVNFYTILASNTSKLSSMFGNKLLGTANAPTAVSQIPSSSPYKTLDKWWSAILIGFNSADYHFNVLDKGNATDMQRGTEVYVTHFIPHGDEFDISLMADFYGSCNKERGYPVIGQFNTAYDGKVEIDGVKSSYTDDFILRYVIPNADFTFAYSHYKQLAELKDETYTTNVYEQDPTTGEIIKLPDSTNVGNDDRFKPQNDPDDSNRIEYIKDESTGEADTLQTKYHIQMLNYSNFTFEARRVTKNFYDGVDLNAMYSNSITELFIDNLYIKPYTESNIEFGKYKSYDTSALKIGARYQLKVEIPEGYFFKGFLVFSSKYQTTKNVFALSGDTMNSLSRTAHYLSYYMEVENKMYKAAVSSDYITIDYDTTVYALFEPRLYTININSYEYNEDATDTPLDKYVYTWSDQVDDNGTPIPTKIDSTTIDIEVSKQQGYLFNTQSKPIYLASIQEDGTINADNLNVLIPFKLNELYKDTDIDDLYKYGFALDLKNQYATTGQLMYADYVYSELNEFGEKWKNPSLGKYVYYQAGEEKIIEIKDEDLIMSEDIIYAGSIKDTLVVERGENAKLTSLTYPFFQFMGWSKQDTPECYGFTLGADGKSLAFTYAMSQNAGFSNPANGGTYNGKTIEENDLYVYTRDAMGNIIRVPYNTFSHKLSQAEGYLCYKDGTQIYQARGLSGLFGATPYIQWITGTEKYAMNTGTAFTQEEIDIYLKKNSSKVTYLSATDISFYNAKNIGLEGSTPAQNLNPIYSGTNVRDYEKINFSEYTTNSLYIFNITSDQYFNVYYSTLKYNLTVDLSEVFGSYITEDSNVKADTTNSTLEADYMETHLQYSEEVRSQPGWKNPSAGSYTYTVNLQTNPSNNKTSTYTIKIEDNDPYVYVKNDYNGKSLDYPTKISSKLISYTRSQQSLGSNGNGTLYYIQQKDGTSVQVLGARSGAVAQPIQYTGTNIVFNQPDIDSDGNYKLKNIYNFVEVDEDGKFDRLKDYIFTIKIVGPEGTVEYHSQDINEDNGFTVNVDLEKGTINFAYKVIASQTGFPTVKITMHNSSSFNKLKNADNDVANDNDVLTLKPLEIDAYQFEMNEETEEYEKVPYEATKSSERGESREMIGFNLNLFEDESFMVDPDFTIGNIDVNIRLKWIQRAYAISASYQPTNADVDKPEQVKPFSLTATYTESEHGKKLAELACKTPKECEHCWQLETLMPHQYEIMKYFLVIIENGQYIYDMLQNIAKGLVSDELKSSSTFIGDAEKAGKLLIQIVGATAGDTNDYGAVYNVGHGMTGQLSLTEADAYNDILYLVEKYYNIKLNKNDILRYRMVEIFDYFTNGVNPNFYGNYMNLGDMFISQIILQEHAEGQQTTSEWLGVVMTAEKGYNYYREARINHYANIKIEGLLNTTKNSIEGDNQVEVDNVKFGQKAMNYFAGVFNGSKKYAATFNRMVHAAVVPTEQDYSNDNLTSFETALILSDTVRVKSTVNDYETYPAANVLITVGTITAVGIVGAFTGGAGLILYAASLSVLIVDSVIIASTGESDVTILHNLVNMNLSFD